MSEVGGRRSEVGGQVGAGLCACPIQKPEIGERITVNPEPLNPE